MPITGKLKIPRMTDSTSPLAALGGKAPTKFVGFVDLLGFSRRVLTEYDNSLKYYEAILRSAGLIPTLRPEVKVTMYSDSFLLVSEELGPIILAAQALEMQTLFNDCLVRGGIAEGKHLEVHDEQNLYVVSEALTKAAVLEKSIKHPCIALHPDIKIPEAWWLSNHQNIERGLLYFGGINLVNPCNIAWGQSAAMRVIQMRDKWPEHRDKFDWFLELHQAIFSPVPMIPPQFFMESNTKHGAIADQGKNT